MKISANEVLNLNSIVDDVVHSTSSIEINDVNSLFIYRIPTVSKDGTCSNIAKLSVRPFNLAVDAYHMDISTSSALSNDQLLRQHPVTVRLSLLNRIVGEIRRITDADWIGLYRVVLADNSPSLLKEAYFGEPSRPLFPLTDEFARKSTNSWVGLTGNVRIISNTRQREDGVSYYECSGKVQSELCVPVLRRLSEHQYQVIGIIDLESWNLNHFSPRLVLEVFKVALDLGSWNFGVQ
jgi:putative methionine-R-sulfoxide reductase with GAF domain